MKKVSSKSSRHIVTRYIVSLSVILTIAVGGFLCVNRSQAVNPTNGMLGDSVGTSVMWQGTVPPGIAAIRFLTMSESALTSV